MKIGGVMASKLDLILPWQQDLPEGKLGFEHHAVKKYEEELSKKDLKKVLLIDDSMRAISTLNKIFNNLGCNTFVSFDGYAAINSLMQTDVDLIILDMMTFSVLESNELVGSSNNIISLFKYKALAIPILCA